ncbi:uncharacterized protein INSC1020_7305, partial [Saccharomyces cerevisiae]
MKRSYKTLPTYFFPSLVPSRKERSFFLFY